MLRSLTLLLIALVGAKAFAPSSIRSSSLSSRGGQKTVLRMTWVEDEIGALLPMGFFDPLGLSKDIDKPTFEQRREAELKHGRIAMLAVVGLIIQDYARLPGSIDIDGTSFESIPNGVAAISAIPPLGWLLIVSLIGYFESSVWQRRENATPGDFGFGSKFFGEEINGTEKEKDLKTKEIQHGRLAMLGVSDLIFNDVFSGFKIFHF